VVKFFNEGLHIDLRENSYKTSFRDFYHIQKSIAKVNMDNTKDSLGGFLQTLKCITKKQGAWGSSEYYVQGNNAIVKVSAALARHFD
jgi:hypothetical protein